MLRLLVCAVLLASFVSPLLGQDRVVSREPLERIVFGSCIRQDKPMPILRTMQQPDPQLLVFLGDNIYADTSDMEVMRRKYDVLGANEDFRALTTDRLVLATWDDHDYGLNDGGADFVKRAEAQHEFLRFWSKVADTPSADHASVYDAHLFGPPGKRVQVILLDTRYFRSPLKTGPRRTGGPYYPDADPSKTMLGEAQWNWLEEQLRQPAELRIIATSIQCIAEAAGQETWSNLPRERASLFQLIQDTRANGVVMISGDRHWAECSVVRENVPYPLFDLTSSSLNQKHERGTPTTNRFRAEGGTYHEENFGLISIAWDRDEPTVTLEIRDGENKTQWKQAVVLNQLQID